MAAQDLKFTRNGDRGHSNATRLALMKEIGAMGRSSLMGVCRHKGEFEPRFKPTRRFLRSNEAPVGEQLIPGIPNEITYDLIVPKLSWRDLPVLSFASRAWEEAILTNRVYEERVRANSTETLIFHTHCHDDLVTFALYSAREKRCYELPDLPAKLPCLPTGILELCQCIVLHGKIYVLGGFDRWEYVWEEMCGRKCALEGRRVYVLDMGVDRWKWKQCASMLEPRFGFGCGVIDDKIYVFGGGEGLEDLPRSEVYDTHKIFGGAVDLEDLPRCEVYDTHKNTWSPIMPMTKSIFHGDYGPLVAPIGKELFLYRRDVETLGVYNPAKDEWRFVERSGSEGKLVFAAEGKFYSISQSGIHVYDVEQKAWINRHTHSFAPHRPEYSGEFLPLYISAVKDELFLTAEWQTSGRFFHSFHAKAFDSEKKEIVWQKTNCTFYEHQVPIQL